MIAFALTAFDSGEGKTEDESYGRIKAYYKTWGLDPDKSGTSLEEIETVSCTKAQLGLEPAESDKALFFKPNINSQGDLNNY